MKKISFILIAAMGLTFVSSCHKKEDHKDPEKPSSKLHLLLRYNMDITNDTNAFGRNEVQYDLVPEGTRVHFTIPGTDLQSQIVPGYNYKDYTVSASVDKKGEISINVPVGYKGSNILINADEFESDYYYMDVDRDGEWVKLSKAAIYKLNPANFNLAPNMTTFQTLTFVKK